MKKVLIIDTSVLCVWLEVPGMNNCGPDDDKWSKQRVDVKIEKEVGDGTTLVLPLATIIETGNHIAQAAHSRRERASALAGVIHKSVDEKTPWAAFRDQSALWEPKKLKNLADRWPELAHQKFSLGDATIKEVAEYYAQTQGWLVEIFTGDQGLKAYEPSIPAEVPRRRQK